MIDGKSHGCDYHIYMVSQTRSPHQHQPPRNPTFSLRVGCCSKGWLVPAKGTPVCHIQGEQFLHTLPVERTENPFTLNEP